MKFKTIFDNQALEIEFSNFLNQLLIKTEVNMSNVSAIVEDISKKEVEKHL